MGPYGPYWAYAERLCGTPMRNAYAERLCCAMTLRWCCAMMQEEPAASREELGGIDSTAVQGLQSTAQHRYGPPRPAKFPDFQHFFFVFF